MRRALAIELRRGVGLLTGPAVAVTVVLGLLAHPRDWAGDWSGLSTYLRFLTLLVGPVAVAAAAWQAGRERRRGLVELTATMPRDRFSQVLASWSSPAGWAAAGFVFVALLAGGVTTVRASYGGPLLVVIASGLAGLLALSAAGFAVGTLLPHRLTAPVLAVATYVGLGAASYTQDPLRYLSPAVEITQLFPPVVWWAPATSVVFLAVAAGLLLVCGGRVGLALVAAAVAVMAAVPVVRTGEDAFVADPVADSGVCRQANGTEVCLSRRHASALPVVIDEVKRMWQGLDGMPRVHDQFLTGSRDDDEPGVLYLNTNYLAPTITSGPDISVVRENLSDGAMLWPCHEPTSADVPFDVWLLSVDVATWLRGRPAAPPPESALARVPQAQRLTAVSRFVSAVRACDADSARAAADQP